MIGLICPACLVPKNTLEGRRINPVGEWMPLYRAAEAPDYRPTFLAYGGYSVPNAEELLELKLHAMDSRMIDPTTPVLYRGALLKGGDTKNQMLFVVPLPGGLDKWIEKKENVMGKWQKGKETQRVTEEKIAEINNMPLVKTTVAKNVQIALAKLYNCEVGDLTGEHLMVFEWADLFGKDGVMGTGGRNGSNSVAMQLARWGLTVKDMGHGPWEPEPEPVAPEPAPAPAPAAPEPQSDDRTSHHAAPAVAGPLLNRVREAGMAMPKVANWLKRLKDFPYGELLKFLEALHEWLEGGGTLEEFLRLNAVGAAASSEELDALHSYLVSVAQEPEPEPEPEHEKEKETKKEKQHQQKHQTEQTKDALSSLYLILLR